MKNLLLLSYLLIVGCSINHTTKEESSTSNEDPTTIEETKHSQSEIEETKHSPYDDIEIVSVKTGWDLGHNAYPQVRIKFKNISNNPITETIEVKYRFTYNDEIIYNGSKYIHSSFDLEWDSGLVKEVTFRTLSGYTWLFKGMQFKACYKDNILIWEGEIEYTEI